MTSVRVSGHEVCGVVMGATCNLLVPEEASQYADAIFIGEAEGLWEEFLNSFEADLTVVCISEPTCRLLITFPWHESNSSTGATIRMGFYLRPGDVRASVILHHCRDVSPYFAQTADRPKWLQNMHPSKEE